MNEDVRKALTLYLGEEWHTLGFFFDDGQVKCSCGELFRCPDEGTFHVEQANDRTFTTPDDMDALRRKMVERGDFGDFFNFVFVKWIKDCEGQTMAGLINWLLDNCGELAGEWLKERKTDGQK